MQRFLVTEWDEFKELRPEQYASLLKEPVLFDGRNCYDLEDMKSAGMDYYSIGRPVVKVERELV